MDDESAMSQMSEMSTAEQSSAFGGEAEPRSGGGSFRRIAIIGVAAAIVIGAILLATGTFSSGNKEEGPAEEEYSGSAGDDGPGFSGTGYQYTQKTVKRTTVTEMNKTVSASVEEMTSEPPMMTGSTPEPTSPMSSTTPPPPKKYVYCVTGDRLTNDHALTSGFCDVAIYSGFVRIRNELKPGLGSYSWQVFRQAIKKGNFTAGISIVVPWPDGPKTVTEHFDKLEQSLMDLNKNENIMAFGFLDIDYEIMNITGTIKDAYKVFTRVLQNTPMATTFLGVQLIRKKVMQMFVNDTHLFSDVRTLILQVHNGRTLRPKEECEVVLMTHTDPTAHAPSYAGAIELRGLLLQENFNRTVLYSESMGVLVFKPKKDKDISSTIYAECESRFMTSYALLCYWDSLKADVSRGVRDNTTTADFRTTTGNYFATFNEELSKWDDLYERSDGVAIFNVELDETRGCGGFEDYGRLHKLAERFRLA